MVVKSCMFISLPREFRNIKPVGVDKPKKHLDTYLLKNLMSLKYMT